MGRSFAGIFDNLNVLVTGHTGFKGSWLTLLLRKLGARVSGFALDPPTNPCLFDDAQIGRSINSFRGDIRNYSRILEVVREVRPELVLHLAAQPLVRRSYVDPLETYSTNVMGTVHLFEACRQVDSIRAIVNITTDKCYQNKEWLWGYREEEQLGGYDPYSNSKACSELVTASYRDSFFNPANYQLHRVAVATARAGNVIGGGDFADDRLIPDFIRSISHGESLQIRHPRAIRPWQHVLEPLAGYLTLAEKLLNEGPAYGEAWNFGPEEEDARDVAWMAEKLCSFWGNDANFRVGDEEQPHEAMYLKLDCSKARTRLDWKPKWTVETALKHIVDWNKSWMNGANALRLCEERIERYFAA